MGLPRTSVNFSFLSKYCANPKSVILIYKELPSILSMRMFSGLISRCAILF